MSGIDETDPGHEVDVSSTVNKQSSDIFTAVVSGHVQRCEPALHTYTHTRIHQQTYINNLFVFAALTGPITLIILFFVCSVW